MTNKKSQPKKTVKLNFPELQRTKVYINDDDTFVYLDLNDVGFMARLGDFIKESDTLITRVEEAYKQAEEDGVKSNFRICDALNALEKEIRMHVNTIFDADVCGAIAGNSFVISLVRMPDGTHEMLFQRIVDQLVPLYKDNPHFKKEALEQDKKVKEHLKGID